MRSLLALYGATRTLGPGWVSKRAWFWAKNKSGYLRWNSPGKWDEIPLASLLLPGIPPSPGDYAEWRRSHRPPFFFDQLPDMGSFPAESVLRQAEALLAGNFRFFSAQDIHLGFPPDWHTNPLGGEIFDARKHWSEIGDFSGGDIKMVWEPARFGSAFLLTRAYARVSGSQPALAEKYALAFWRLVEDFVAHNQPHRGPQWKCGQETSFRVMALCFAERAFAGSPSSTPARTAMLAALVAISAQRIEAHLDYAISQKNNHGISEGVGLFTAGTLFPELKSADRWRRLGRKVIEEESARQIYEDGSYVQHSFNYHRVMLHDLIWPARLAHLSGEPLSGGLLARMGKAIEFLYSFTDEASGQTPNHGSNDGAMVLPLSVCDYTDFRPVLQSAGLVVFNRVVLPHGDWDEEAVWLMGKNNVDVAPALALHRREEFPIGGYYRMGDRRQWAMLRSAQYHDRPSHADQLHLDLWISGQNLACDAGTYHYQAPSPWNNSLVETRFHNTVTVDHKDQMARASKFLWLDWSNGQVSRHFRSDGMESLAAWHDGYARLGVRHERRVFRVSDCWIIVDELTGTGSHHLRLHWLMPDLPFEYDSARQAIVLNSNHRYRMQWFANGEATPTLFRAGLDVSDQTCDRKLIDQREQRGWRSLYYAGLQPALSFALEMTASLPQRFVTVFSPAEITARVEGEEVVLAGGRSPESRRISIAGQELQAASS